MICVECGDNGILLDGTPCVCAKGISEQSTETPYTAVPPQYLNVRFSDEFVKSDLEAYYATFLRKLHDDICKRKLRYSNQFISSPVNHSKSVFAYSCIQSLFRSGADVFPLVDMKEAQVVMRDVENSRRSTLLQGLEVEPSQLLTVEYLFLKVLVTENYRDLQTLIERRVRRGNSTILLSSSSWNYLQGADKSETLIHMIGDGSYNSVKINNFWVKK